MLQCHFLQHYNTFVTRCLKPAIITNQCIIHYFICHCWFYSQWFKLTISPPPLDSTKTPVDDDEMDRDVPRVTLQDMLDELTLEDPTGVEGGPMVQ